MAQIPASPTQGPREGTDVQDVKQTGQQASFKAPQELEAFPTLSFGGWAVKEPTFTDLGLCSSQLSSYEGKVLYTHSTSRTQAKRALSGTLQV